MTKEKMDTKISFRLPKSVNQKWRDKAQECDMNLGDWIRSQIHLDGVTPVLSKKKTPKRIKKKREQNYVRCDPKLLAAITKIGNNINQIAHSANSRYSPPNYESIDLRLKRINSKLDDFLKC